MASRPTLHEILEIDPDSEEVRRSSSLLSKLSQPGVRIFLCTESGEELEVPYPFDAMLRLTADELSEGHEVLLMRAEEELTPAAVAKILGLSRPYVIRLLDEGVIAFTRKPNSDHRLIRREDLLAYMEKRSRRRAGVNRVVETAIDAGEEY